MDKAFTWLTSDFVTRVVRALGEDNIKFVGGAVRDSLLKRPVSDIDAATSLLPPEVMTSLEMAGIKTVPTGIDHGTITAVDRSSGQHMEITSLRVDVKTDGRHADVAFTDDWTLDAMRRDFTMNAIYVCPNGEIFDPLNGLDDAKAGRVRFIGNASDRIKEDALRILRLFRFHAHYGQHPLVSEDLMAAMNAVRRVGDLSVERVRDEVMKLLSADTPAITMDLMLDIGMWHAVHGRRKDAMTALARLEKRDQKWGGATRAIRRIAVITAQEFWVDALEKLHCTNKEQAYMATLSKAASDTENTDLEIRAYLYGKAATLDAYLLGSAPMDDKALEALEAFEIPVCPVSGKDLLERGVAAGVEMGKMLKNIEKQWLESHFSSDKSALLADI